MDINGVNNVQQGHPHQPTSPANPAQLSKEAFLQLLVAQLKYQDPLRPTRGDEFIDQLVQMSTVEQLYNLSEATQRLLEISQLNEAMSLVEREVTVKADEDNTVSGKVEKIGLAQGKVYLYIKGRAFELSSLVEIN